MKRMLLVFTNGNTAVGQGGNFDVTDQEKERLKRVVERTRMALVPDLGYTLLLAEFWNLATASVRVIAEAMPKVEGTCTTFVQMRGLIERIDEKAKLDTTIVSCLSYYPDRRAGNRDIFFQYFSEWWNTSCIVFGMPRIPDHAGEGDGAMLFIDYEKRTVEWFDNVGKEKMVGMGGATGQ